MNCSIKSKASKQKGKFIVEVDVNRNIEIRVQNAPWYAGYQFAIFSKHPTKRLIVTSMTFEEVNENQLVAQEGTMNILSSEAAQTLMNDLWHSGLRPTDGTGSAGQLQATQKHLEDMRKIAFSSLAISMPE